MLTKIDTGETITLKLAFDFRKQNHFLSDLQVMNLPKYVFLANGPMEKYIVVYNCHPRNWPKDLKITFPTT